jgi:hypothetical protein
VVNMADAVQGVLADFDSYERLARNARGRVEGFFQLHDAMRQYNVLYRRLGGLPELMHRPTSGEAVPSAVRPPGLSEQPSTPRAWLHRAARRLRR